MPTTLVSLISAQTFPNLILMKEMSGIDRHLFITTEEMERKGKSTHLKEAVGLPEDNIRTLVVESDSMVDIQQKLDAYGVEKGEKFIVNLTPGTKMMSIGVYNWFRDKNCEMYYIYIGKNVIRKVFPLVREKEKPALSRVSLQEYLTCYGIRISNPDKIRNVTKPPEYTLEFFKLFHGFSEFDKSVLGALRMLRNRRKKSVSLEEEEARLILRRWKFKPDRPGTLSRDEIEYLTGDWFEEYVYTLLKKELDLNDDEIATGVKILRDDVQNEFDVLFIHNQTLHVIECKTGIWDSQAERNIINDTLYKIDALSRDFGLRVRSFIFTLAERGEEKHQVRDTNVKRANHFNVEIISKEKLTDPQAMHLFFAKIY